MLLGHGGDNNAALACIFYRTNPTWSFAQINAFGPGKVFTESEALITKNLVPFGFDPILLEESRNWNPQSGKKFNIVKDQAINLPPNLTKINFGLGWESNCDIDAGMICLDKAGMPLGSVYYACKVHP